MSDIGKFYWDNWGNLQEDDRPDYDLEKAVEFLKETMNYIEDADDRGSVDFAMMAVQEYFGHMKPIGTPEGGI